MAEIQSQQELYDIFQTEVQSVDPALTDFNDGSTNDIFAGVTSSAVREIELIITDLFNKTFIDLAQGPDENGGGADDLQTLAVDHYGDDFARPGATPAIVDVTFSRPTAAAGACTILAGTIVKTAVNANGVAQRFATLIDETLGIGVLTINASVQAQVAGSDGNVNIGQINLIETALTDATVVVTNAAAAVGGAPAQDSPTYRETIKNKLQTLAGATLAAIEAKAKTVAGVETATAIEQEMVVIEFDIGTNLPKAGAKYFYIPNTILYIADANGTASQGLIDAVVAAIATTRAAGVRVPVLGASAFAVNWTAVVTLNPSGPNYSTLSVNTQQIKDSMSVYVKGLPIGSGFLRSAATAAMMAIYGPAGTGDLVTNGFQTVVPTGDIAAVATQKLIPGTMGTA